MTATISLETVTDQQLSNYAKLVYTRTGIHISPQKKSLLSNRLRRRLKATGIADYDAYFKVLKDLKSNDPEWDAFLQEVTTHETYLFRDEQQWKWFQEEYLPQLQSNARKSKSINCKTFRVWSAACSTGDEAYTVAACIAGSLANHSQWDVKILGTDIGVGAVQQANSAVFGERAMRLVPENLKSRHFQKATDGNIWQAKPNLVQMTEFRPHNLMDPLREKPFDLVILKNVLIYFDTPSKEVVLGHLLPLIKPGGYFVAGPAEGVTTLLKDKLKRLSSWLYQKEE